MEPPPPKPKNAVVRFLSVLGPGVISGAADDDPSGIATYSVAGAQLGTSLLWTAFITFPLMAAVQMMCSRIGMVTGKGLATALRHKFPRQVLIVASMALLVANTINVGADLAAMADSAEMLSGINSHLWVIVFAVLITWATVRFHYHQIAAVLKWLALSLCAYIVTALIIRPQWSLVVHDTFVPSMPRSQLGWSTLVALLGTTISPYLFFWQSSQEVEEEKAKGRHFTARLGAAPQELHDRALDVGVGTFASNVVMYFIILTTALTLHKAGLTEIETSRQAAEALRPLAGDLAYLLYTAGILGVGFLAIPTLTGSAAYALAETFGWRQGLDKSFQRARPFYLVVLLSTVAGVFFDYLGFSPIKALYWTAVINGLLAPFLLTGILLVAADRKIMRGQPSSPLAIAVVALATLAMFAAGIAMFVL